MKILNRVNTRWVAVIIAIVTLLCLFPVQTLATPTSDWWVQGSVKMDGQNIPVEGSTVTARIGDKQWTGQVYLHPSTGVSYYDIRIPWAVLAGEANGGNNGDIVSFFVTIEGRAYLDPTTAIFKAGDNVKHLIWLTKSTATTLKITTESLADGVTERSYTVQLEANETDKGPYIWTWSAAELPEGLDLSEDGLITGTPLVARTYTNIRITVTDNELQQASKYFNLKIDLLGDADGINGLNRSDRDYIAGMIMGVEIRLPNGQLFRYPAYLARADINQDGFVNVIDAIIIRYLPGYVNSY